MYAEGRKYGCDDFAGQHDIVLKRSIDFGRTWGPLIVVADPTEVFNCSNPSLPKSGRCQFWDPTVVFDSVRNRLVMLAAYASSDDTSARESGLQSIFMFTSNDTGLTWSRPRNISFFFQDHHPATPSNGHGIQLTVPSKYAGRLIIPCYSGTIGSGAYWSDDGGETWNQTAQDNFVGVKSSEGDIVQVVSNAGETDATGTSTSTSKLLYTLRLGNKTVAGCGAFTRCRIQVVSMDGGATWIDYMPVPKLPGPMCKAGLAQVTLPLPSVGSDSKQSHSQQLLLFAGDWSTTSRVNVTLSVSKYGGVTWPVGRASRAVVWPGNGGYVDVIGVSPSETGGSGAAAAVVFENNTCAVSLAIVSLPLAYNS